MRVHSPSFKHLRIMEYFVEVSKCGSIRQAAEKLNLTASALNRRILNLEQEAGTPLFDRWAQGVRLTLAGEILLRYADQSLRAAADVSRTLTAINDELRGQVNVLCSQALAAEFLPDCISNFHKIHPATTISAVVVNHAEAIAALKRRDAQLALIFSASLDAQIRVISSLPQRVVALMQQDHPLAHRKTLSFKDCSDFPLAMPSSQLGVRSILDDLAAHDQKPLQVMMESNSFDMLRSVVMRSDAITFQIEIGVPRQKNMSQIFSIPLADEKSRHQELALCALASSELGAATMAFAEYLSQRIGGSDGMI